MEEWKVINWSNESSKSLCNKLLFEVIKLSVGHTRVYDRLRRVATSCCKWTQKICTSCIFGHICETSLRLIYYLSQLNVRRPCDGRNWSYKYLPLTASDRKNVCHRQQATVQSPAAYICSICAITHVQHTTIMRSLASIAWTSCVYQPVVPNVLYCFVFVFVCVHGSQRHKLYFCRIIAI